jgi:hypothetical protein
MSNPDLERLRAISGENYLPNEVVQRALGSVTCINVIAPHMTGKTYTVRQLTARDHDFHAVVGFTDRPMRSNETAADFDFLERSEETTASILAGAESGDYAQITVHPTGTIYGSTKQAWSNRLSVLTPITSEIPGMHRRGHRSGLTLSLVTHDFTYDQRLLAAYYAIPEGEAGEAARTDFSRRIQEGRNNLAYSWGKEEQEGTLWVPNLVTDKGAGALRVIGTLGRLGLDKDVTQEEAVAYARKDPYLRETLEHGRDLARQMTLTLDRWHKDLSSGGLLVA